jgi:hypothetical protein
MFWFFLNQLDLFYIWICLYLQQNKIYGSRKQMGRIMSYDNSLARNDILKFIFLFYDPISYITIFNVNTMQSSNESINVIILSLIIFCLN